MEIILFIFQQDIKNYSFYNIQLSAMLEELSYLQGKRVKNYVLEKKLGEGSFSVVYKAIDAKNSKQEYAIKIMKTIPENDEYAIKNEIMLLKKINHRNVVKFTQYFTDEKNFKYIVLEFCGKGDLAMFFKKQGKLPETVCRKLASSIIHVFSQLHSKGIVHRDLKLANILITDNYQFKIADFGMAKMMEKGICETQCGTPFAMAPEIIRLQSYDGKCDVWSLGVMIFQLIYGRIPFTAKRQYELKRIILEKEPIYDSQAQISGECLDFMKKCLIKNKDSRPSMIELKDHQWFDQTGATVMCLQFFKGTLEEKNKKVVQRTKEMIVEVMKQHINRLVKSFGLTKNEIDNSLKMIQKYEKEENLKALVLLALAQLLKLVQKNYIEIKIGQKLFKIKLSEITIFRQYLNQLLQFLNSHINKLSEKEKKANFLLQLVNFSVQKTEKCLGLENYQNEYLKYILFVSKLPLYLPQNSQISSQWAYQQIAQMPKKSFNFFIATLKQEQLLDIINSNLSNSEVLNNWLVQHNFSTKRREGGEYAVGQYMVKILEINSNSQT